MFTILGASGFIGGSLATALRQDGHEVYAPTKGDPEVFKRELGDVIYAAGVTADFRSRPFDTVEAHVCLLRELLQSGTFRSLLYLSSTRVYSRTSGGEEGQHMRIDPQDPDELYTLSKLLGESLCSAMPLQTVRSVRLSNVYGSNSRSRNFLDDVLRQALLEGKVRLHTTQASVKDYISISDVVSVLPRIALSGKARLYNVAGGRNIAHAELMASLSRLVPLTVEVDEHAPTSVFPEISIERARKEFGFAPRSLLADLPELLAEVREVVRNA